MDITLPYRIMGVDPATGLSGWCILDILSLSPLSIRIVAHGALDGQKLLRTRKELAKYFQSQFCTLDALEEEYERLITVYQPNIVVSEGAFHAKHLSAYMSLKLAIHTLRRASRKCLNKDLVESPPTISKAAWSGKGNADKPAMRAAYHRNDYLIGRVSDDLISEHEIDAAAHAIGHLRRDIIGDIVQISAKERRQRKRDKQKEKAVSIERA